MQTEDWIHLLHDPGTVVEIHLDGIAGSLLLPRRDFRSAGRIPEHLFWYVLEGCGAGSVSGEEVALAAGSFLWISPEAPFSFLFTGKQRNRILRFRLRFLKGREPLRLPIPYLHLAEFAAARFWFEQLIEEAVETGRLCRSVHIRSLVCSLVIEALRACAAATGAAPRRKLSAVQQRRLGEYFAGNLHRRISPQDLASHAGYSLDYFTKLFRATFGMNPRTWILEMRMQSAAIALEEGSLNVGEVAQAFGFGDPFYFSRQFKRWSGMSPSQYRRR